MFVHVSIRSVGSRSVGFLLWRKHQHLYCPSGSLFSFVRIHSFIHSFIAFTHIFLLSTYSVLCVVLGAGETVVKETASVPDLVELTLL